MNIIKISRTSFFFFLAFILCTSCTNEKNKTRKIPADIAPQEMADGWQTASLNSVGIGTEKLQEMVDRICDDTYQGIHSILIIKNDRLVFEQYFKGYTFKYEADECKGMFTTFDANTLHNLASVTKSVTSILFGIACDQRFIDDVNDKLFKYFPEYASLNDSLKNQITLQDMLTMTSGFQWNEQDVSIKDANNDLIRLFGVADPVEYILSKPIIHQPGSTFYYNGGNTNLLGEVLHNASGMMVDDFANNFLFDPMGINRYSWVMLNPKMTYASGDLKLRPRDMAKIGYLMLNKGLWKDKRIVSEKWVEHSTAPYFHFNHNEGYGYQWWIKEYMLGNVSVHSYSALGWGGQRIVVFPGLDAVVVFTAGNYETADPIDEILYRYVVPSLNEQFKYDYVFIQNEAPIPDTINIVEPSQSLSNKFVKLSGHWHGLGDYLIAGQLVVENIDSTQASVIYAWGDHPDGYFKRGWVRKKASVNSNGEIEFQLNDATLNFMLDKNEDVLIGYYRKGNAKSKLIFDRL